MPVRFMCIVAFVLGLSLAPAIQAGSDGQLPPPLPYAFSKPQPEDVRGSQGDAASRSTADSEGPAGHGGSTCRRLAGQRCDYHQGWLHSDGGARIG